MYKHILVSTDGSPLSMKAARAASALAAKLGARMTAVYVIPPFDPPRSPEGAVFHVSYSRDDYESQMRKAAERATAQVAKAAGAVRCDRVSSSHPRPWEGIIKEAKARKCDLIVMASHGRRGLEGLLLGSETQKVLTHSNIPVLVCR